MKNRLNINNNFATVRRVARFARVRAGTIGGGPAGRDRRARAVPPLTSSAASLLAAAPVTALAPTVSAALAAAACLLEYNCAPSAERSALLFNITLFNIDRLTSKFNIVY